MKKTFNPETVRSNKVFFESKVEALAVAEWRRTKVWKVKFGRHKGKHFVGSQLEFFNVELKIMKQENLNGLKELKKYLETLQNNSFEGWSEEQINAYMTAIVSVMEKITEIEN